MWWIFNFDCSVDDNCYTYWWSSQADSCIQRLEWWREPWLEIYFQFFRIKMECTARGLNKWGKSKIEAQVQRPNLSQGGFRRLIKYQFTKEKIFSDKSTAREQKRIKKASPTDTHTHTRKPFTQLPQGRVLRNLVPKNIQCSFLLSVFISWFYLSCELHSPIHDCYILFPFLPARQTFLNGHCSVLGAIHKFSY